VPPLMRRATTVHSLALAATEKSSVQRTWAPGAFFHADAGAVRERAFTIDDGLFLGETKLPDFNVECRARFFLRRGLGMARYPGPGPRGQTVLKHGAWRTETQEDVRGVCIRVCIMSGERCGGLEEFYLKQHSSC
jgi:hypothetical protein